MEKARARFENRSKRLRLALKNLHELVKETRHGLGWSMDELAQRAGVSKTVVAKIENQQSDPRVGTLLKLCDAMDLSLWKVFMEEAKEEVQTAFCDSARLQIDQRFGLANPEERQPTVTDTITKEIANLISLRLEELNAASLPEDGIAKPDYYSFRWYNWADAELFEVTQSIAAMFEPEVKNELLSLLKSSRELFVMKNPAATRRLIRYYFAEDKRLTRDDQCFTSPCVPENTSPTLGGVDVRYYDHEAFSIEKPQRGLPSNRDSDRVVYIAEVVQEGDFIVYTLKPDQTASNIVLRDGDTLRFIIVNNALAIWIRSGSDGVLVCRGDVVNDRGSHYSQLASSTPDHTFSKQISIPVIGAHSLVRLSVHAKLMDHATAADYLDLTKDTLYKRVASGEITRGAGFLYRKSELDRYLMADIEETSI